jgi:uncharacterized repeat protein (TIGR03803 family)
MQRIVVALGQLNLAKRAYAVFAVCITTAMLLPAQTLTTLHNFARTDGSNPAPALVQATDGNLYGTTRHGGAESNGTVFKISPTGTLTTLYNFCSQSGCTDGSVPTGLVQATDGDFYGTTSQGGAGGFGTLFKIDPSGELTTLHSFCSPYSPHCTDGGHPTAVLVQAANAELYGTTRSQGAHGHGTIFKITQGGKLTTLYPFCSQTNCTDGEEPFAGLVQGADGDFYGTAGVGGSGNDGGTVFKVTPSGTLTTLYSFCAQGFPCTDGLSPHAGLVQAANGEFYGTTFEGGAYSAGTVFKITPNGTLSTVYSFCSQNLCRDGANPEAAPIQANNGDFYGTTINSGANGGGTVFKITPTGKLTTLYSFCAQIGCTDGRFPDAGLVQASNGNFYGTTSQGGASDTVCDQGCGTVFSLSIGLGQIVKMLPASVEVACRDFGNQSVRATSNALR